MKTCFLLGIMPRSGTNYIYHLMRCHPDCFGYPVPGEDYFLMQSELLIQYARETYNLWPKKAREKLENVLPKYIGNGLISSLTDIGDRRSGMYIAKTPRVVNLNNFRHLFPDCKLILLVRDGRSVVESAVKSFDYYTYESASTMWRDGARTILKHKDQDNTLLVRFEDVVKDRHSQMERIFAFLEIDPGRCDYERADNMGVIGSSQLRDNGGTLHWKKVEKPKDFNPLNRYSHWSTDQHCRFNWIAGNEMALLGYELESAPKRKYTNKSIDIHWRARNFYRQLKKYVKKLIKQSAS